MKKTNINEGGFSGRRLSMKVKHLSKCPACGAETYVSEDELNFPVQKCKLCYKLVKMQKL